MLNKKFVAAAATALGMALAGGSNAAVQTKMGQDIDTLKSKGTVVFSCANGERQASLRVYENIVGMFTESSDENDVSFDLVAFFDEAALSNYEAGDFKAAVESLEQYCAEAKQVSKPKAAPAPQP